MTISFFFTKKGDVIQAFFFRHPPNTIHVTIESTHEAKLHKRDFVVCD